MQTRLIAALVAACSLFPATGCYFGRSRPTAKPAAYLVNAAAIVAGGALIKSNFSLRSTDAEDVGFGLGVLLAMAGATGVAINVMMPTQQQEPARALRTTAPDVSADVVTAPGLQPAHLAR